VAVGGRDRSRAGHGVQVVHRAGVVRARSALVLAAGVFGVLLLAYLITTPGTLLDAGRFWSSVVYETVHYRTGHGAYTVSSGREHFGRIGVYLAWSLGSRYPAISLGLCALALVGLYALLRDRSPAVVVYLSFPTVYVLFVGLQRVMFVRNLLLLAPTFAVLVARGAAWACDLTPRRWLRGVLIGLVALALIANGVWLACAARSIALRGTGAYVRDLAAYLKRQASRRIYASPRVLGELGLAVPHNVSGEMALDTDLAVTYAYEEVERGTCPANDPRLTVTWFGPWEVNWNYYPTWPGDERIVVLAGDRARALGIGGYKGQ